MKVSVRRHSSRFGGCSHESCVTCLCNCPGTASAGLAQDPAKVDAVHSRVLIDNARTRVFRVTVGPGEKVPMHEHPDAIMIPLTPPPTPDGSPAPAAIFMSAQRHGGDNPGTTPVDFIYVELKGDAAPTAVVPSNRPGITSTRLVERAVGIFFALKSRGPLAVDSTGGPHRRRIVSCARRRGP